jgi:hypothetical protein
LPEYPFIICTKCHYAYIANKVKTYLQKHHYELGKKIRGRIVFEVKLILGVIRSQEKLRQYLVLEFVNKLILIIAEPKTNRL